MKTETRQIHRIIEEFQGGWLAGSEAQFAAAFAPQARFVAFDGTTLTGPSEIANFHQRAFDSHLQGTALDVHIEEIRLVAPGVWLVWWKLAEAKVWSFLVNPPTFFMCVLVIPFTKIPDPTVRLFVRQPCKRYVANLNLKTREAMKKWVICCILTLGIQVSLCTGEENIRKFRTVDPIQLEKTVPVGYGQVFVQAGRENNIDPVLLAAISTHESGRWKSRTARQKNNWMGLMTRSGAKNFGRPEESIFYAAELLNRKPFRSRNTLSEIAPIYCTKNPGHWKASVLHLEHEIGGKTTAEPKGDMIPFVWCPDLILTPIGAGQDKLPPVSLLK
jgi:hypothetical protein